MFPAAGVRRAESSGSAFLAAAQSSGVKGQLASQEGLAGGCSHLVGSCSFFHAREALRGRAVLAGRERVCSWEQAGYFTFSEEFSTFLLFLSPSISCVCNGGNQRWEPG